MSVTQEANSLTNDIDNVGVHGDAVAGLLYKVEVVVVVIVVVLVEPVAED